MPTEKLLTEYPLQILDAPLPVSYGQWRGVIAKHVKSSRTERTPVNTIVEQAQDYHRVNLLEPLPTLNLDGLLVALQAGGHYVSMVTLGRHPLKGKVSPDWITVMTSPEEAHLLNSDMLMRADEFFWECTEWSDVPQQVMGEILSHTLEQETPRVPVFYFSFSSPSVKHEFVTSFRELPVLQQAFWRIHHVY